MARYSPRLSGFASGEWSPLLYGRVDSERYAFSCRKLENFVVSKQGPVKKRPGTRYVTPSSSDARIIPWIFSQSEAFVLEFTDGELRFITEDGPVETTPGSGIDYVLATPYVSANLPALQYAQSADVMYLTHPEHAPYVLSRIADNNWTIEVYDTFKPPLRDQNTDKTNKMRVDVSGSDILLDADSPVFADGMEGGYFRLYSPPEIEYDQWEEGVSYTTGDRVWSDSLESPGRVNAYKANNTGTSGKRPPGHDEDVESDGAVDWEFLHDGAAYVQIDSVTDSTNAVGTLKNGQQYAPTVLNIPEVYLSTRATGTIALTGQPTDGDTIVVDDSTGPITFEFDDDSSITVGNVQVVIGATNIETAENLANAIDTQTGMDVSYSGAFVDLVCPVYGVSGNIAITKTEVGSVITVLGMEGGYGDADRSLVGSYRWSESEWSTYRGWPSTSCLHEGRLWFSGTSSRPLTAWGSVIEDYPNFDAGLSNDDDAVTYTISTNRNARSPILWMSSNRNLLIGTESSVFANVNARDTTITPTNIRINAESKRGSADALPAEIGNSVVYIQRGGQTVRELLFAQYGYKSVDRSAVAEHLLSECVSAIVWQEAPDEIMWAYTCSGQLIGCTFDSDEGVIAWHQHDINGEVQSMAVIPSADADYVGDRLWLMTKRVIGGIDSYHMECMSFNSEHVHVDSYVRKQNGTAFTTIDVSHLIGETVSVVADGAYLGEFVVPASGTVDFDEESNEVYSGYGISASLVTQQMEGGSTNGTAQGKGIRTHNLVVRVKDTGPGLYVGSFGDHQVIVPFRKSGDDMDEAVPLFSGDTGPVAIDCGFDDGGILQVDHRTPLPCTVLALWPQLEVKDQR